MSQTVLASIPLSSIRENPVALRNVNRMSPTYKELVDSVKRSGILNAILVREIVDPRTKVVVYGLIDGLHRFSAAQDAGLTEIPAQVRSMEDAAVLEAQVIANVQKVETRPVEYSKQLVRILAQNPLLTLDELSSRLAKSPTWLNERLGLVKLDEAIGKLVDEGRICLSNGYAIAKLSAIAPEEVSNYVDRAMVMSPNEFVPTITSRVKELKELRRQGRDATPATFQPVAHIRKLGELKEEMENPKVGPVLIKELNVKTPKEAFELGVKWALHMDPASIELQKQKDAERKAKLEAEKLKRKEEREKKSEEEARKAAADVTKL